MTNRALLMGSQTYGLTGCNADVALMKNVLTARGFDSVETLIDADTSRAGIVTALERLVAAIQPDDAVVVYFSGHGGRVARPDAEQRKSQGLSTHFHFIVPFDMDASEPDDFRGFLSEEMTVVQRRMTDAFSARGATPNVTMILDCCHSGYFARSAGMVQKSVDLSEKMFRLRGIREHAQQLGSDASALAGATNPNAVRLVACQTEQSAYELDSPEGGKHGALTQAFASVLAELGDHSVSWSVVGELVRRRVRTLAPEQRPEIEGPATLALFSTETVVDKGALPIGSVGGLSVIEAAALLGVDVGDEFRLEEPGRDESVGTAVVSRIDGSNAVLTLTLAGDPGQPPATALPANVMAVRSTSKRPRYAVAIETDADAEPAVAELGRVIDMSTHVRIAVGAEPVIASVQHRDGFVVLDPLGALWRTNVWATDAGGIRSTLDVLEGLAIGHRLLDLPSGLGANALSAEVGLSFGVVRDGTMTELDRNGARLRPGDRVSLSMQNASQEQLFVWVFDVGVSGRSALLTNAAPSGALLGAAGAADDRFSVWSAEGQELFWPTDVPTEVAEEARDSGRQETFVVVLADRRGDLSSLATPVNTARGEDASGDLEAMLSATSMTSREVPTQLDAPRPLRHRIEEVSFFLCPPETSPT